MHIQTKSPADIVKASKDTAQKKNASSALSLPSVPVFQFADGQEPEKEKQDPAEKKNAISKKTSAGSHIEEQKSRNAIAATVENMLYQRKAIDEEEHPLQLKEKESDELQPFKPLQKKENNTGLPGNLKSGIENLSGFSMDDVNVHYNSEKPAQLQALAYAQGTDIHIAPGQEKHLPHEAWHVVQQKQGRVKATMQMKGAIDINDDAGLEREADIMGSKAALNEASSNGTVSEKPAADTTVLQRVKVGMELTFSNDVLKYMHFDKKEYDKNPMPLDKWNGMSHTAYCKQIKKDYFKKWEKQVVKNNSTREGVTLETEDDQQGKGAAIGLNTMFNYSFVQSEDEDKSDEDKEITEKPDESTSETDKDKSPVPDQKTEEQDEKKDDIEPKDPLEDWWWDIDVDPMCLEIRAQPIDHTHLDTAMLQTIIQEDIFDVALNKLGLKTGYAGEGGGHISIDLESGFDNDYINVVKTLVHVELLQKKIDTMVQIIDVFDEKNAPYLFDPSRQLKGLHVIKDWLINLLNTPIEELKKEIEPQKSTTPPGKQKQKSAKSKKKDEPKTTGWDVELKKLAEILLNFHTSSQTPAQLNPPKGGDWHTPLHYQNINIQHTRSAERHILDEEARRVEFRRLVAQRSYAELMQVVHLIIGWVNQAKKTSNDTFLMTLGTTGNIEKITRTETDISTNQKNAEIISKEDKKRTKLSPGQLPEFGLDTDLPHDKEVPLIDPDINIKGEQGVERIIVESVVSMIKDKGYKTDKSILVVDGKAWHCYIRCVLHHFNMISKYDQVLQQLSDVNLSSGVTVGGATEALIQSKIVAAIAKEYHVEAIDVSHQITAISENAIGDKVTVLLTGAHFSLLQ